MFRYRLYTDKITSFNEEFANMKKEEASVSPLYLPLHYVLTLENREFIIFLESHH